MEDAEQRFIDIAKKLRLEELEIIIDYYQFNDHYDELMLFLRHSLHKIQ